jgi:hypothetical protein
MQVLTDYTKRMALEHNFGEVKKCRPGRKDLQQREYPGKKCGGKYFHLCIFFDQDAM